MTDSELELEIQALRHRLDSLERTAAPRYSSIDARNTDPGWYFDPDLTYGGWIVVNATDTYNPDDGTGTYRARWGNDGSIALVDSHITLAGADGYQSFGVTPPVHVSPGVWTGTGIGIDYGAIVGLLSDVVQAKFDAATGAITAAAGAVVLDVDGVLVKGQKLTLSTASGSSSFYLYKSSDTQALFYWPAAGTNETMLWDFGGAYSVTFSRPANKITTSGAMSIGAGQTYQINGTQIAASDLSNGTTGTGAVVLASALPAGIVNARIASDYTSSDVALSDVTGLSFAIGANEVWEFDFYLACYQSGTGGIKVAINGPSGATTTIRETGNTADVNTFLFNRNTSLDTAGATFITASGFDGQLYLHGVMVNGANAGTLQLRGRRGTANGTARIYANSYLVASKLS